VSNLQLSACQFEFFNIAAFVPTVQIYEVLPFTDSNNLKTKHLHLWMRGRRAIERREATMIFNNGIGDYATPIDCPALSDVVFKAGSSNMSHPGNSVFHEMIRNQSSNSQVSPDIVNMIYENVTRRNGRFLEWDSCGYWNVVPDPVAVRKKIYCSCLHAHKSSNAKKRMQNNSSNTFLFERQDGRKRKRGADGTEISSCTEFCRY
jgi:hypothetical protein